MTDKVPTAVVAGIPILGTVALATAQFDFDWSGTDLNRVAQSKGLLLVHVLQFSLPLGTADQIENFRRFGYKVIDFYPPCTFMVANECKTPPLYRGFSPALHNFMSPPPVPRGDIWMFTMNDNAIQSWTNESTSIRRNLFTFADVYLVVNLRPLEVVYLPKFCDVNDPPEQIRVKDEPSGKARPAKRKRV